MSEILYFDLETNGLDLQNSCIMQMSILDSDKNIVLNEYVIPWDGNISGKEIHGIDEEVLTLNHAISLYVLYGMIQKITNHRPIYWIAYNTFGFDQIIFENNMRMIGKKIPSNWYFIDILPMIREIYPSMKPNHKLVTAYFSLCDPERKTESKMKWHNSLTDVYCLYDLCQTLKKGMNDEKWNFLFYEKYKRSSLYTRTILNDSIYTIPYIFSRMDLERKGYQSIGDFYNQYKLCNKQNDIFHNYMKERVGIYSEFILRNLWTQMVAIDMALSK